MPKLIPQRVAYWMDYYRCRPPEFVVWDVDSFVSHVQIWIDESGKKYGDHLINLGWSHGSDMHWDMAVYGYPVGTSADKPVVIRARGELFIDEATDVNSVIKMLDVYSQDIAPRPPMGYDLGCAGVESSSQAPEPPPTSSSQPSTSAPSLPYGSSSTYYSSTPQSSAQQSSAQQSSAQQSSTYSSYVQTPCDLVGCPGAVYHELLYVSGPTEAAASSAFMSSAEALCLAAVATPCAATIQYTQHMPPFGWFVSGYACCQPLVLVDLDFDLVVNTNVEPVTYAGLRPENNPVPVGVPVICTGIQASSSAPVFDQPNTVVGLIFNSTYPRRSCLVDQVSSITLTGTFSNPGTTSVTLVYNSGLSDLFGGGRPYFFNANAGLPSLLQLNTLQLTITECGSSSGG